MSTADDATPRHLAVLLNGFSGTALENTLDMVAEHTGDGALRPVVITRDADLSAIRRRGLPVEVVLDPQRFPSPDLDPARRIEQQLAGIMRLWQPVAAISLIQPGDGLHPVAERLRQHIAAAAARPGDST